MKNLMIVFSFQGDYNKKLPAVKLQILWGT